MTPEQLVSLALQQAQGDTQKALHLLAEEVCAQMNTGYHRRVNQGVLAKPQPTPEPL